MWANERPGLGIDIDEELRRGIPSRSTDQRRLAAGPIARRDGAAAVMALGE